MTTFWYAKQRGISYRTALRWFRTGTIKGYQVSQEVKEIESGVNDSRPKLLGLLKDTSITAIEYSLTARLYGQRRAKLIELLTYKAELVGITVLITEESYTSKASFLDRDVLPTYDPTHGVEQEDKPRFSGRREGRWYRVKGREPIHADVNGSYNIGRKVFPTAFDGLGIEATAVRRHLACRLNEAHVSSCHEVLILCYNKAKNESSNGKRIG